MTAAVETMAYAGEVPWHGLGTKVDSDLTPAEMLVAAGLDWTVEKIPAYATLADGTQVDVGKSALVRSSDNRVLTVCGPDWNELQNQEAFEFFDEYVREGNMKMHTAGSLRDGQIVWALAEVTDGGFELFGKDRVDQYMLLSNMHKYGKSHSAALTAIRVVCQNTLNIALDRASDSKVTVSHRVKFDAEQVKRDLGLASVKMTEYRDVAEFLGSKQYNDETLEQFFGEVFPTGKKAKKQETSRNAQRALEIVEAQPGGDIARGSWWQAFNAVTYLTDHEIGRSNDTRMAKAWFGSTGQKKVNAMAKAMDFAKAA